MNVLKPKKLRDLTLSGCSKPFVSAASGLQQIGVWLYVIADDENFLARFHMDSKSPGECFRILPAELPKEHRARKAAKADFEALVHLPLSVSTEGDVLLCVGSGAAPRRRCVALVSLADEGGVKQSYVADVSTLYSEMGLRTPLNIEGAAVIGQSLLLFNRKVGPEGDNGVFTLPLQAFLDTVRSRQTAPLRPSFQPLKFDSIFGFTDAYALPDGRIVYSAVAEDAPNSYEDGPVYASRVGITDAAFTAFMEAELEPPIKVEGLIAEVAPTGLRLLMVTDPDDAAKPGELYEMFWQV